MIIVDTDVLIEILDKGSKKGDKALARIEESEEDVAITSLTMHEVLYGVHKYGKTKEEEK
jgi:PIN domain.